jgi:glycyl-tRNA synthetase
MAKENTNELMEKIVSLCKRRGFIFAGSEIYGGLAGTWDYGPLGVTLKNNIKNLWWQKFVTDREDMYGLDAAIIMAGRTWEASGHVAGFADPLVECEKCHKRFREDQTNGSCPECGGQLSNARQFNMMFSTQIGAVEDSSARVYLRPETAQGIFVNFKNIVDSYHPKLPFGVAQIGKAFRNEITPRDFVFRVREFEQMEIEYFIREEDWENRFEHWRREIANFIGETGIKVEAVRELDVPKEERAFYSKRTIDFEFDYPFGRKELCGLAYRTNYDLSQHVEFSGKDLNYFDEQTGEKFIPHVIEPSLGVDRLVLAILTSAYTEDELGGEKRAYLKFNYQMAPTKVAVFPLLKNKPELVEKAQETYKMLQKELGQVAFDDNGNIGKRYRRQDEIGTPYCVTIDFDTLGENPDLLDTVTVRDRDTGDQQRLKISELIAFFKNKA